LDKIVTCDEEPGSNVIVISGLTCALGLAGCSSGEPSVAARSFSDGQNYASQHTKSGTAACFEIYQLPQVPVPKGDNLKQWLSGCISVFHGQGLLPG
jgi:hypothetical protein